MGKRYYWLKLKDDFFDSKRIKKLRRLAGGDTFVIIYLKMQLIAIKTDGCIKYSGLEKTFAEELALDLDEDVENVSITLQYLLNTGLIETSDEIDYFLPYAIENVGSETAVAQRVRDYRGRQKALQCNTTVTQLKQNCNGEKEKEIEKEIEIEIDNNKPSKHRYGEYKNVLLTDTEYEKLQNEYPNADKLITFLDEYIEMKGYKAKSHYLAIKKWVVDAVKERKQEHSFEVTDKSDSYAGWGDNSHLR